MRRAIKSATLAQQDYQDRARALGCVVCRYRGCRQPNATHIHHRNIGDLHGQKQLGQDAVVAMCAWHHDGEQLEGYTREQMRAEFGPSFKATPRDFREWTYDALPGMGKGTEAWQAYQDSILENGK